MSKLYQYSHFLAVSNGSYEGELKIEELKRYGNYGLGTFNSLDGELVIINNHFYHCSNRHVRLANDNNLLAWAAVSNCHFNTEIHSILNIPNIKYLESHLLKLISTINYPYIFFIKADCESLSLGSVPKQSKPYPPIAQVIENSVAINLKTIEVDIIGFYAPKFMYPMKSTGLHLHFVSTDRNVGGHILDLSITRAEVQFIMLTRLEIVLPKNDFYKTMSLEYPSDKPLPVFQTIGTN